MREQSVPCRGSTLRESIAGLHRTFNDSAVCDRCEPLRVAAIARVREQLAARASARGDDAGEAPAASPASRSASLLLGDASRDPSANAVPATSLPDRYSAGSSAPASPLGTPQGGRFDG